MKKIGYIFVAAFIVMLAGSSAVSANVFSDFDFSMSDHGNGSQGNVSDDNSSSGEAGIGADTGDSQASIVVSNGDSGTEVDVSGSGGADGEIDLDIRVWKHSHIKVKQLEQNEQSSNDVGDGSATNESSDPNGGESGDDNQGSGSVFDFVNLGIFRT